MREDLIVSIYSHNKNIKVLFRDLLNKINRPLKVLRLDILNENKDTIINYLDKFKLLGNNTIIEMYRGDASYKSKKANSIKKNNSKKRKTEISEVLKLIPEEYKLKHEYEVINYLCSFLYSLCFKDNKKRVNLVIVDSNSRELELIKKNEDIFNKIDVYICEGNKLLNLS